MYVLPPGGMLVVDMSTDAVLAMNSEKYAWHHFVFEHSRRLGPRSHRVLDHPAVLMRPAPSLFLRLERTNPPRSPRSIRLPQRRHACRSRASGMTHTTFDDLIDDGCINVHLKWRVITFILVLESLAKVETDVFEETVGQWRDLAQIVSTISAASNDWCA